MVTDKETLTGEGCQLCVHFVIRNHVQETVLFYVMIAVGEDADIQ